MFANHYIKVGKRLNKHKAYEKFYKFFFPDHPKVTEKSKMEYEKSINQ